MPTFRMARPDGSFRQFGPGHGPGVGSHSHLGPCHGGRGWKRRQRPLLTGVGKRLSSTACRWHCAFRRCVWEGRGQMTWESPPPRENLGLYHSFHSGTWDPVEPATSTPLDSEPPVQPGKQLRAQEVKIGGGGEDTWVPQVISFPITPPDLPCPLLSARAQPALVTSLPGHRFLPKEPGQIPA